MKIINKPRYIQVGKTEPFDERDTVQSRYDMDQQLTTEWLEYYERHPEWERYDREMKTLPGLGAVGDPLDLSFFIQEVMQAIHYGREDMVDAPFVAPVPFDISPARAAEKIKGFARHLGADLVRIGPLNPDYVYTHIGKTKFYPDRQRGTPIHLTHKSAVSMAISITPGFIKSGPVLPSSIETLRVYTRLGMISDMIAGYIRSLGFSARAHNLFNYQVLCVPVAIDAGLGELSRMGIMITKELGPSLKLATVTTDMPLDYDPPVDIGVEEFCRDCKICAKACPSSAIPYGKQVAVRGVLKWKINPQACFRVWNETGTDCGICIASCPWTKPGTFIHQCVREIASRKMKAGWWMSRAERLAYGRFRPLPVPDWFEKPGLDILKKYKRYKDIQP